MKMKNNYYPSQAFYDSVDKMELSELEDLIVGLSDNIRYNAGKIHVCFGRRYFLLTKQFECNAENVARFGEIMLFLKEQTATIFNATKTLYRQLHKQFEDGDTNGFRDFRLETSLRIEFDEDDSVFLLDENTESRYFKMAEIFDIYYDYNWGGNLVDVGLDYRPQMRYEELDDTYFINNFGCHYCDDSPDDWGEGWFKRDFPQLAQFPIPYAAHQMLFHASYALQDVVRIKSFCSEIKVIYDL